MPVVRTWKVLLVGMHGVRDHGDVHVRGMHVQVSVRHLHIAWMQRNHNEAHRRALPALPALPGGLLHLQPVHRGWNDRDEQDLCPMLLPRRLCSHDTVCQGRNAQPRVHQRQRLDLPSRLHELHVTFACSSSTIKHTLADSRVARHACASSSIAKHTLTDPCTVQHTLADPCTVQHTLADPCTDPSIVKHTFANTPHRGHWGLFCAAWRRRCAGLCHCSLCSHSLLRRVQKAWECQEVG